MATSISIPSLPFLPLLADSLSVVFAPETYTSMQIVLVRARRATYIHTKMKRVRRERNQWLR